MTLNLDRMVADLDDAISRLTAARDALAGDAKPPRPSRRRAGTGTMTGTGRSRRAEQVLAMLRESPGLTAGQIAERLGIHPNYLYRVLPRLEREGRLRRDGHGWQVR